MFIVLEGIDGCGKTTQTARISEYIASIVGSDKVLATREPGGWDGGEAIRELVLRGNLSSMWSEFFLFMMDRCEHVCRVIAPAILCGGVVVCDRYSPSTLAYQILSRPDVGDAAAEYMIGLSDVIGLPKPDRVFFLDISPDEARARLDARGNANSFDVRGREYFERVRAGYERIMKTSSDRWVKIDAASAPDEVFDILTRHVDSLIGEGEGINR